MQQYKPHLLQAMYIFTSFSLKIFFRVFLCLFVCFLYFFFSFKFIVMFNKCCIYFGKTNKQRNDRELRSGLNVGAQVY